MQNNKEGLSCIDIREDDLLVLSAEVLKTLLRDHTTGQNIFWATHDYEALGKEYDYHAQILPEMITGGRGMVIRPRVLKTKERQVNRVKDMAEVFTPAWVCNAQNNLVDEAWFGRKDTFNVESANGKSWKATNGPIQFPKGKTWKDYVRATRMEMACGEGPYLVSRYDTTSGKLIPLEQRIGLLDRKLRVIGENTETSGEWLEMAQEAYKNIYGFEWQGDSLLLARESMLWTFIEYYHAKFSKIPLQKSVNYIAYIISWNIWQMDGLKGVVPESCRNGETIVENDLFGNISKQIFCQGCQQETYKGHNGTYCFIRDWGNKDPKTGENNRKIRFIDLIK
ncbi:MAG: restriction endonuclease subunit M [Prevotella sp.]|nr:restriction endonuclease subunit M [Prevotella sp.]